MFGEWRTSTSQYVTDVERFAGEIGALDWVAPQDWMCEPHMLERTGLTVADHQRRTVTNFHELRARLGPLVIPVLQGWATDDYLRCWNLYDAWGHTLEDEPVVGLGTVCRRQNTADAGRIVRALAPLNLHGFGVKLTGLRSFADALTSADSMAWSSRARLAASEGKDVMPGHCTHRSHANCLLWALRWRENVADLLRQPTLFAEAA
jgi:hypothetical protein